MKRSKAARVYVPNTTEDGTPLVWVRTETHPDGTILRMTFRTRDDALRVVKLYDEEDRKDLDVYKTYFGTHTRDPQIKVCVLSELLL